MPLSRFGENVALLAKHSRSPVYWRVLYGLDLFRTPLVGIRRTVSGIQNKPLVPS